MKTFGRRISRKRQRAAERGVALILVMLFLGLMLLLGLAATTTSITEVNVSGNLRLQTEAFETADAGAAHAFQLVRWMNGDFTALLRGDDDVLKNGDEFADANSRTYNSAGTRVTDLSSPPMFTLAQVTPIPPRLCADGVTRALVKLDRRHLYELIPYDDARDTHSYMANAPQEDATDTGQRDNVDGDQRVMIRSIGYVMKSDIGTDLTVFDPRDAIATSVVDVIVGLAPFPAIISNDNINLTNSVAISGAYGSVHANNDLLLGTGNYTVSQSATFANQDGVTPSGWDVTADDTHVTGYNGPAAAVYIPDLKPYTYAKDCELIFIHKDAQTLERTGLVNEMNAASAQSGTNLQTTITNAGYNLTDARSFLLRRSSSTPYTYTLVDSSTDNNASLTDTPTGYNVTMSNSGTAHVTAIPSSAANGRGVFVLLKRGSDDIEINSNLNGYISLFTNGNVHVNGNSNLYPSINITTLELPPWDYFNVLVMAGQDIVMNGNGAINDTIRGVLYCHEGFDLSGSGAIQGQVVGYEHRLTYDSGTGLFASTSGFTSTINGTPYSSSGDSPVGVGTSIVHGNFAITFNAGTGFLGTFSQLAWRQLHDFNPVTDPRP